MKFTNKALTQTSFLHRRTTSISLCSTADSRTEQVSFYLIFNCHLFMLFSNKSVVSLWCDKPWTLKISQKCLLCYDQPQQKIKTRELATKPQTKLINLPCGFSFLTPDLWRPVLVQTMKIKLHYKSVLQAVFHIVLFCVVAIVWCQA